jgi:hypothetical protein
MNPPKIMTDYWDRINEKPPRCCYTCDAFNKNEGGFCKYFNMEPPKEYVEEINDCPQYLNEIPF